MSETSSVQASTSASSVLGSVVAESPPLSHYVIHLCHKCLRPMRCRFGLLPRQIEGYDSAGSCGSAIARCKFLTEHVSQTSWLPASASKKAKPSVDKTTAFINSAVENSVRISIACCPWQSAENMAGRIEFVYRAGLPPARCPQKNAVV